MKEFDSFQGALMGGLTSLITSSDLALIPPWQSHSLNLIDTLIESQNFQAELDFNFLNNLSPSHYQSASLALILLPLFVYFHDDLDTLQQHLQFFRRENPLSPMTQESLFLWGSAIAVTLKRQTKPTSLITQLRDNYPDLELSSHLGLIQTSLDEGMPLNQLQKRLSKALEPEFIPLMLALFCFSDTPETPHLSYLRTRQISSSPFISGLISALIGANGGLSHLPLLWQTKLVKNPHNQELINKIKQLWKNWTGNMTEDSFSSCLTSVATPLVLQPRASLRLISQSEYLAFRTKLYCLTIQDNRYDQNGN